MEPTFLVPSVFAQSRWIVRRLTLMERLLAYDLPEHMCKSLCPGVCRRCLDSLIPGKILLAAFSTLQEVLQVTEWESEVTDEKKKKGNGNQRVNLKRALVVNHEDQNQKKTKLEKKEETLLSKENKRHLCATKGDDEEVQTKLWEEFLLRGAIPVRKEADLEKGLKPIRNWLLQYWKRKVTCSFIRWLWSREDQKKAWNSGRLRQLNTIGLLLDTKPESAVSAVLEAVCVSP